jgi:hypothetical protein
MAPLSSPATTVSLSSPNVLATITPVSCNTGTPQYQINSRTNDGSWTGWTAWSTTTTASQTANQGVKYGYQAQARCYVDASDYSAAATGSESTYIQPINAPSAPSVTTPTTGSTTTWSWPAVSCPSGTTANYQYDYTVSPAGSDSGWVAYGTNLSIAFTTSTGGQTYTVAVQAKCTDAYYTSSWSGSGSNLYYSPVTSWLKVSAGTYHTCAIASNNNGYCWGDNVYGELGNNSTTNSSVPVPVYTGGVLSGLTLKDISAGSYSTCAIASDNNAYCWGYNPDGELGNNSTTNSSVPVAVYTAGVLSGKTISRIAASQVYGWWNCASAERKKYCKRRAAACVPLPRLHA